MHGEPRQGQYFMAGAVNNPRSSWLEYLGLAELDEWTLEDLRDSVSSLVAPAGPLAQGAAEPSIGVRDFGEYLRRVGEPYRFLATNRQSIERSTSDSGRAAFCADELPTDEQLRMIPEVCFTEAFDLTRPETFNIFSPPDQPHTTMVNLERLTHYLDQVQGTIELKLLNEVSTKSTGILDALHSYEILTREVATSCGQIEALRTRMRTLETNLALKSMRLPRMARRRVHTAALLNKLRLIHAVWRTQPTIQQLLSSRDFPSALELITSSQHLLETELAGVTSLGVLKSSLEQVRNSIKDMMSKDLLRLALGYDPDSSSPVPTEVLLSEMETKLMPSAAGLLRLGVLPEAIEDLEEQLKRDVRQLVKRRLQDELLKVGTESADRGSADTAASLNKDSSDGKANKTVNTQLRELQVDDFEATMSRVFSMVLTLLRRAAIIDGVLRKTLAGIRAGHSSAESDRDDAFESNSPASIESIEKQSAIMVQRVCDLAQDRYARLLKTRKDVHSRLPLTEFVRMRKGVIAFVNEVKAVNSHDYDVLTSELQLHAQAFLQTMHESSMHKLEAIVEIEQWKQVDVAPEFQQIVEAFSRNQVPQIHEEELLRLRDTEASDIVAAAKELVVGGAGFKVVSSGLLLLNMVAHYMQCIAQLQGVAVQVAHLLPALLKLFHTQAYKQVLQAGALRPDSAGLKSIAAKHLALTSNSLGLALALFPHLKAILAAHLPDAQRALLREMDSVVSDYEAHQQQLFAKFVSILEDRRRGHVATLREALAPSEERRRPETTANMKAIVKDLASMHKQLQPLLTQSQLHTVFNQVLKAFDSALLEAYSAIDTTPLFSRQCIVQDVHYLRQEMAKLQLNLPQGCCPQLVQFGMSLPVQ